MLVGKTERLPHPSEADIWFDIRPLSGDERDEASKVKVNEMFDIAAKAGEAFMAAARSNDGDSDKDPHSGFDKKTTLHYGLREWNYTDKPCDDENKKDLDGWTRDWLFTEIMKRSVFTSGEG